MWRDVLARPLPFQTLIGVPAVLGQIPNSVYSVHLLKWFQNFPWACDETKWIESLLTLVTFLTFLGKCWRSRCSFLPLASLNGCYGIFLPDTLTAEVPGGILGAGFMVSGMPHTHKVSMLAVWHSGVAILKSSIISSLGLCFPSKVCWDDGACSGDTEPQLPRCPVPLHLGMGSLLPGPSLSPCAPAGGGPSTESPGDFQQRHRTKSLSPFLMFLQRDKCMPEHVRT